MPLNKSTLIDYDMLFGIAMGAGCILGISFHVKNSCPWIRSAIISSIYDHIFELTCLLAQGKNYELAIMQKQELMKNAKIEDLDRFINLAVMYYRERADLVDYQNYWQGRELDYDTFLHMDDEELREFLQSTLVYLRLLEDVLQLSNVLSNACIKLFGELPLKSQFLFELLFKPIFKVQRDGILRAPLRMLETSNMLMIDLAILARYKFDREAFETFFDDHILLRAVHITHFDCASHYPLLNDLLNILRKNARIGLLTVMIVGEQDRAMLCAIAAQIRIMEHVQDWKILCPRMSEHEVAQNLEQISTLQAQWRAQERALSQVLPPLQTPRTEPYSRPNIS